MEEELKTLKDLADQIESWDERYHIPSEGHKEAPENGLFVFSDTLRQEAIKHVKKWQQEIDDEKKNTHHSEHFRHTVEAGCIRAQLEFIFFFNLTKKDLK